MSATAPALAPGEGVPYVCERFEVLGRTRTGERPTPNSVVTFNAN